MSYPQYMFITIGWYAVGWWRGEEGEDGCTSEQRGSVLSNTLSTLLFEFRNDRNTTTDTGIVSLLEWILSILITLHTRLRENGKLMSLIEDINPKCIHYPSSLLPEWLRIWWSLCSPQRLLPPWCWPKQDRYICPALLWCHMDTGLCTQQNHHWYNYSTICLFVCLSVPLS